MKNKNVLLKVLCLVLILLTAFAVAACGSSGDKAFDNDFGGAGNAVPSGEAGAGAGIISENPGSVNRLIVYSYSCSLYTDDLDGALGILTEKFSDYTGYMESSSVTRNDSTAWASLVFRVKTEHYAAFVNDIGGAGTVRDKTSRGDDVTLTYVDLQYRKEAKEEEYKRLLVLYDRANSISEITSVNARLAEAERELLALNAQLFSFDSQLEYSKVSVTVYQSEPPKTEEKPGFWKTIGNAFAGSGKAIAAFFKYVAVVLIYAGPFLLIGAGIFFGIFFYRRKHPRKKKAAPQVHASPAEQDHIKENS